MKCGCERGQLHQVRGKVEGSGLSRLLGAAALLIGLAAGWPAAVEVAVLEVKPVGADVLPEGIAEKARAVKGVVKVERYLLIKTQPHDVIGVEPGAPLRIVTQDDKLIEAALESGKKFRKEDDGKNVAIVGSKVYAEDYGGEPWRSTRRPNRTLRS